MSGPLCIYHGHCDDGFAAAWVVRCAAPFFEFHAGVYQQPPPDVTGRNVLLVDFSYKRPVLLEMAAKARSIVILDHHKTAAEDLAGFADPGEHKAALRSLAAAAGAGRANRGDDRGKQPRMGWPHVAPIKWCLYGNARRETEAMSGHEKAGQVAPAG